MTYQVSIAGRELEVRVLARRPELRVDVGPGPGPGPAPGPGAAPGAPAAAAVTLAVLEEPAGEGVFELRVNGEHYRGWCYAAGDEVHVRLLGRTFIVGRPRDDSGGRGAERARDEVHADMPGVVVAVHCAAGAAVNAGDKLVTLESMKLQITLVAHRDGHIEAVHVKPNASFERGALLVSFRREAQP